MTEHERQAQGKSARLNLRATPQEKRAIEAAARMRHMSASQFVMQASLHAAEAALVEQTRFALPPDRWDAFVVALDRPARVIPALERAATRHARRER